MTGWTLTRAYRTSFDRAGLALGTGALIGGVIAGALVALGSVPQPLQLLVGFIIGTVITGIAIIAVGGPLWLVAHLAGRCGPGAAAVVGAIAGFALFLGGQTYGFGLFPMPPNDAATLAYRWASAAATSAIMATLAAGIALAMWRVAYRRIGAADR